MDVQVAAPAGTAPSSPLTTHLHTAAALSIAGSDRPVGRKRRRGILFSGNTSSSSSSDDDLEARPALRLRRLNSHMPNHAVFQPDSQSPLVRSHTPSSVGSASAMAGITSPDASVIASATSDMELDLEVDTCFRAMHVDSPTYSPASSISERKAQHSVLSPKTRLSASLARPSPNLFIVTPDERDASLPRVPRCASETASVFPSSALVAASTRRNSRVLEASTHYVPLAPSPLANTISFCSARTTSTRAHASALTHRASSTPPCASPDIVRQTASPPRRNSDGDATVPKPADSNRSQQMPSPTPLHAGSPILVGCEQTLRHASGFRQDCHMCRGQVPGLLSHVLGR